MAAGGDYRECHDSEAIAQKKPPNFLLRDRRAIKAGFENVEADQKSADCHALHDERVDEHRGICIGTTEQYVVGVGGGRIWDGGDE